MVNAGRVLIIPKGAWDNQTEYAMLDAVRYNGSMYIAKQASTGIIPDSNPTYWFLSAEGVVSGAFVESFNNRMGVVVPTRGDYDITQISAENANAGQIPILVNNGTEQDPDLVFEMQDIPSSGHTVVNSAGTEMPFEEKLQFNGCTVTDDPTNGKTIVAPINGVIPVNPSVTTGLNIWIEDV